jgi:hypothetical protein
MTEHKATPEQWADTESWAAEKLSCYSCILELRARVEALEAKYTTMRLATLEWGADVDKVKRWSDQHLQRIEALEAAQPIDEEENDRRFHACMDLIRNATPEQIRAAAGLPERKTSNVYEINEPLQLTPEQAQHVRDLLAPEPRRNYPAKPDSSLVQRVHSCIVGEPECGHMQARAAILEVAAWLRSELISRGVAERLEQEASND